VVSGAWLPAESERAREGIVLHVRVCEPRTRLVVVRGGRRGVVVLALALDLKVVILVHCRGAKVGRARGFL
jgi:hypothetical protein